MSAAVAGVRLPNKHDPRVPSRRPMTRCVPCGAPASRVRLDWAFVNGMGWVAACDDCAGAEPDTVFTLPFPLPGAVPIAA